MQLPVVGPEIVVGLVGATGTDLERVAEAVEGSLVTVSYKGTVIHLSRHLSEIAGLVKAGATDEYERLKHHMDGGDRFRETLQAADAMARLGLARIRGEREAATGDKNTPSNRRAYILRSLKHPREVQTLRAVYGSSFILLGAYCPRARRVESLSQRIAASRHELNRTDFRAKAEELICRDESGLAGATGTRREYGQNVRETFPLSDVFINAAEPAALEVELRRFIQLWFGFPFETPTKDEFGMFHAQAAALRSASLARQVGAAICSKRGELLAVGCNDVPRPGGGLYWSGDPDDNRDHILRYDTSDAMKRTVLEDIVDRLMGLTPEGRMTGEEIREFVKETLEGDEAPLIKEARLMKLIEFSRSVHAEMAALTEAAKRGVPIEGSTLYTTTFPCHDCARHLIAAGVGRVVYVEPYPKSLAAELYEKEIALDPESAGDGSRVCFQPFVGVAPRAYMTLFQMEKRKEVDGSVVRWQGGIAAPKQAAGVDYLLRETLQLADFDSALQSRSITLTE